MLIVLFITEHAGTFCVKSEKAENVIFCSFPPVADFCHLSDLFNTFAESCDNKVNSTEAEEDFDHHL